jgi:hypothetical protein
MAHAWKTGHHGAFGATAFWPWTTCVRPGPRDAPKVTPVVLPAARHGIGFGERKWPLHRGASMDVPRRQRKRARARLLRLRASHQSNGLQPHRRCFLLLHPWRRPPTGPKAMSRYCFCHARVHIYRCSLPSACLSLIQDKTLPDNPQSQRSSRVLACPGSREGTLLPSCTVLAAVLDALSAKPPASSRH